MPGTKRDPRGAMRLFSAMPEALDLRDEASLEGLLATADALLERSDSLDSLCQLEHLMAANRTDWPLAAHVAVKLARSKAALQLRRAPLDVSVVVAVYGEHERILRPFENPLGEGFLDRKLRQLAWLTKGLSRARTELVLVDDGCPHGSGEIAEQILSRRHPDAPVEVLYLERAIAARHPITRGLRNTDDSRKGGSIQLGLHHATRRLRPGHVVSFSDADLSTHLGQLGLLIAELDRPAIDVAVGSRRTPTSIVVKSGARSSRGRLFIYLWKKLLPEIGYLQDTQCGFKAFRAPVARGLVSRARVRDFAFDLELLLLAELRRRHSIAPVPIAWIDSEAASTTVALSPYLSMLQRTVELQRRYGKREGEREAFAHAIDSLDEGAWDTAVDTLGPRLADFDPALDTQAHFVAPNELAGLLAS